MLNNSPNRGKLSNRKITWRANRGERIRKMSWEKLSHQMKWIAMLPISWPKSEPVYGTKTDDIVPYPIHTFVFLISPSAVLLARTGWPGTRNCFPGATWSATDMARPLSAILCCLVSASSSFHTAAKSAILFEKSLKLWTLTVPVSFNCNRQIIIEKNAPFR